MLLLLTTNMASLTSRAKSEKSATSEKSDSLGPKLSARSFMGLFGGSFVGTSRAATLNYDEA